MAALLRFGPTMRCLGAPAYLCGLCVWCRSALAAWAALLLPLFLVRRWGWCPVSWGSFFEERN